MDDLSFTVDSIFFLYDHQICLFAFANGLCFNVTLKYFVPQ